MTLAAPLATAGQRLDRRDAVGAKQIFLAPTLVCAIGEEGAMQGYLLGLVADGTETLPLGMTYFPEKGAELDMPARLA